MKEIFKPLFILLAAISMTSCTDMLDIKPTTFVSDDLIWQDKKVMNRRYKLKLPTCQSAVGRLYRNDVILKTRLCLSTSSHSVYRWMKPGYHSGNGVDS